MTPHLFSSNKPALIIAAINNTVEITYVIPKYVSIPGGYIMSKEQNSKKNVKKAPVLTAKEKKQAKQAKKIEKKGLGIN